MKLQHFTVIFIIIMLPITLILSSYIQTQIDTIALRSQYDTALTDATHDAMSAFELNTMNNEYSTVTDSIKRDVQASVNVFFNSISNNLGVPGYTEQYIQPYVPAFLTTLYDGYYIYAPTNIDGKTSYTLKPYVYYSERIQQENIDIVVNYSLDSFITIYGTIDGTYYSKCGYLVKNIPDLNTSENLREMVGYKVAKSRRRNR